MAKTTTAPRPKKRKINDALHAEVERQLNLTIHELVFAIKHSDDDQVDDACNCLITAQSNIERIAVALAALEFES